MENKKDGTNMTFDEYAILLIIILAGAISYFLAGWLGIEKKNSITFGLIKNFLVLISAAFLFAMCYFLNG